MQRCKTEDCPFAVTWYVSKGYCCKCCERFPLQHGRRCDKSVYPGQEFNKWLREQPGPAGFDKCRTPNCAYAVTWLFQEMFCCRQCSKNGSHDESCDLQRPLDARLYCNVVKTNGDNYGLVTENVRGIVTADINSRNAMDSKGVKRRRICSASPSTDNLTRALQELLVQAMGQRELK